MLPLSSASFLTVQFNETELKMMRRAEHVARKGNEKRHAKFKPKN